MKDKIKLIGLLVIFVFLLVIISVLMSRAGTRENLIYNDNAKASQIENGDNTITNDISLEVNSGNFESEVINSDKKVLIDFYATWCGPWKVLSPVLEEVAIENEDIKLVKIDVDQNQDLVYKYGITAMPTIIVVENRKELNRSVGVISKDMILELLNKSSENN